MSNKLSIDEIEEICKKYDLARNNLIQNVRSSELGLLLIEYIQELTFSFFIFAAIIEKRIVKDSSDNLILLDDFLQELSDLNEGLEMFFYDFFSSFRQEKKNKYFILNSKKYQFCFNELFGLLKSDFTRKEIKKFPCIDWSIFKEFIIEIIKKFQGQTINSLSPIYEKDLSLINRVTNHLSKESKIDRLLTKRREKGVFYTPKKITKFMTNLSMFSYLKTITSIKLENLEELEKINEKQLLRFLQKAISEVKILDLASGSGEFLIEAANQLLEVNLIIENKLNSNISNIEIRKKILEKNLFGVDLLSNAISLAKIRLWFWLVEGLTENEIKNDNISNINFNLYTGNSLIGFIEEDKQLNANGSNISAKYLEYLNKKLKKKRITIDEYKRINAFHWNKTFQEIINNGGFDIIIGNPPYIEIKKFKNLLEKRIYSKTYFSSYKLYDISILFIERALRLLKDNGFLSFIITNKFLSTDFGLKIRELLLRKTKIHSIIDISYLPIFRNVAAYPVIFSVKKMPKDTSAKEVNKNKIKITPKVSRIKLLSEKFEEGFYVQQQEFKNLPNRIFAISEKYELISIIEKNPSIIRLKDLGEIKYRLFGFTNWTKFITKIAESKISKRDLKFITTTNITSYYLNWNKEIRVAKKKFMKAYFPYSEQSKHQREFLIKPKLLVKEIAKELTVAFDPGIFANLTGIYMFHPEKKEDLKVLLLILNSTLIRIYYQTLFSSTHMAGGYLRFNGSYLKQLPIILPTENKAAFEIISDYLLFLKKGILTDKTLRLEKYFQFFSNIADIFVYSLYFPDVIDNNHLERIASYLTPLNLDFNCYLKVSLKSKDFTIIKQVYQNLKELDFLIRIKLNYF